MGKGSCWPKRVLFRLIRRARHNVCIAYLNKAEGGDLFLNDTIGQGRVRNPDTLQVQVKPRVFVNPVCDVRDVWIAEAE
jgi:hypothetical protein